MAATPLLGSALAGLAITHAGTAEQRARWLPGLASGELTGGFGTPGLAAGRPDAAVFVLAADGALTLVDRDGADVEPIAAIDPTRRYAPCGATARRSARARSTAPPPRSPPSSSASASARST